MSMGVPASCVPERLAGGGGPALLRGWVRGAGGNLVDSPPELFLLCQTFGNLAMSNFWDVVWLMVSTFFFIAYLIIMFQIVVDLFRDSELGGGSKALWVIGLILVPVLTAIIYIIARGKGMAARQQASLQKAKAETETYIKEVAGKSPATHIAEAKALLDAGTINQAEFDKLKAKALA
jgi:ABC-type multidrug transport system fused ATPase/permease subunit